MDERLQIAPAKGGVKHQIVKSSEFRLAEFCRHRHTTKLDFRNLGEALKTNWCRRSGQGETQEQDMEYRVKSGARAVQVLEYFHRRGTPARGIEIGRDLELSASSTNDLLKTLVEVGYLEFNEKTKAYFIGSRAALFGHWAATVQPDVGKLRDLANELRHRAGECVVLSAQRGHVVQFLSILHGPEETPAHIAEGLSAPVIDTAAGAAILMNMNGAEISQIVKRTYHMKKVDRMEDQLSIPLKTFRKRGYACPMREDYLPDYWVVAMPLPVKEANRLALGMGGPKSRIQEREHELAAYGREAITKFFGGSGGTRHIQPSF